MNWKATGKNCQKRKLGTKWEQNIEWRRARKEEAGVSGNGWIFSRELGMSGQD